MDLDVSSDETEAYWPLEDDTGVINKKATESEPKHRLIHSHPSKRTANFSFSVHGIRQMQPKYNLYCVVKKCKETFATVKSWNSHYRLHHKTPLKCDKCTKRCKTGEITKQVIRMTNSPSLYVTANLFTKVGLSQERMV